MHLVSCLYEKIGKCGPTVNRLKLVFYDRQYGSPVNRVSARALINRAAQTSAVTPSFILPSRPSRYFVAHVRLCSHMHFLFCSITLTLGHSFLCGQLFFHANK